MQVVALINSDLRKPVTLFRAAPLEIDGAATPPAQTLRPIKETLVRPRDQMKVATPAPDKAGAVADWARGEVAREAALASLEAYLKADIPPQPLRWSIRTPPGVQGRFPLTVTAARRRSSGDDHPRPRRRPPRRPRRWTARQGPPSGRSRSITRRSTPARTSGRRSAGCGPSGSGWSLYLLAYLPVMFGLRAALRVA